MSTSLSPTPDRTPGLALRRWSFALACLWTAAILVLVWLPSRYLPVAERGDTAPKLPHLDKLVHAGAFGLFGILWLLALAPRRWPAVLTAGLALAAITEIGQSLPLIARDADLLDTLADAAGLLAGLGLSLALTDRPRPPEQSLDAARDAL